MRKGLELVSKPKQFYFQWNECKCSLPQMLVLNMNFQIIWSVTFEMTILTWKWFFFGMNQNVQFHLCRFFHDFWAIRTSPLTRSQMNWIILQWIWGLDEIKQVILQKPFRHSISILNSKYLIMVCWIMLLQVRFHDSRVATKSALKRFSSNMSSNMFLSVWRVDYYFIANWTSPLSWINFDWQLLKLDK